MTPTTNHLLSLPINENISSVNGTCFIIALSWYFLEMQTEKRKWGFKESVCMFVCVCAHAHECVHPFKLNLNDW